MGKRVPTYFVLGSLWSLFISSAWFLQRAITHGPQILEVLPLTHSGVDFSLSFRFDGLSAPLFAMISALGVTIGHYSVRYLDGERRKPYFFRYLFGLIASVSTLVLSENLVMFFVTWLMTGFCLHKLLLYFRERPKARAAALKRQVVSRIGDAAILVAGVLIFRAYGTTTLSQLMAYQPFESSSGNPELIGMFIVLAALTKSAQFPFHAWLPETMETPTPVSALMHAGVINAGGFLIIRFSPLMTDAVLAHGILILVGAFTATYASLVMVAQNNIKSKLAYSTISQMGFMLFACGLGAYGVALFHIIAHSFYKSHAFLATGQVIREARRVGFKHKSPTVKSTTVITLAGLVFLAIGITAWSGTYLALSVYGAVMFMALAQNRFVESNAIFNGKLVLLGVAGLLALGFFWICGR